MNPWLFLSGVLAIIPGVAHGYLGEKQLIGPLLSAENVQGVLRSKVSRNILRGVWHLPAASWGLMGLMTIYYSFTPYPPVAPIAFAISTCSVALLVNLAATKGKHIGWPLLLVVSLLAVVGLYT